MFNIDKSLKKIIGNKTTSKSNSKPLIKAMKPMKSVPMIKPIIIGNILGNTRKRGGKNDWDGDGILNKKDCQPRNTMRQDGSLATLNAMDVPTLRMMLHRDFNMPENQTSLMSKIAMINLYRNLYLRRLNAQKITRQNTAGLSAADKGRLAKEKSFREYSERQDKRRFF